MHEGQVVGVGQLHPLGVSGRTGRVELNDVVVRRHRYMRIGGRLPVAPRIEDRPVLVRRIDGDVVADGFQLVPDLVDQTRVLGADKEDFGLGVVQDIDDFRRREAPIDADQHGVGLEAAIDDLEKPVGIEPDIAYP